MGPPEANIRRSVTRTIHEGQTAAPSKFGTGSVVLVGRSGKVRAMRCLAALVCVVACTHPAAPPPVVASGARTITVIGTNDLHGALDRLPLLAGYVNNVRAARAADGGAVVLIDAGDLFQGTLESNLAEGADVIKAFNQLGYVASAIGNHEFDYGPVGPAVIVKSDRKS